MQVVPRGLALEVEILGRQVLEPEGEVDGDVDAG